MNIRVRKILTFRWVAAIFLLMSIGLSSFALAKVIMSKPEKLIIDCIALGLVIAFAIGQIILILRGWKKESHLIDIAFNTDYTINKLALVLVIVGTTIAVGLNILTIIVLCTRDNTPAVINSMFIIMSISTYLLLNCSIYFLFVILFKKRELTLEDYAK